MSPVPIDDDEGDHNGAVLRDPKRALTVLARKVLVDYQTGIQFEIGIIFGILIGIDIQLGFRIENQFESNGFNGVVNWESIGS